jgi:hypothetical protein
MEMSIMTEDTTRRLLTRTALLAGTGRVEHVYFEELQGELALRPLTDGEYARVEAIKSAGGMTMTAKPKVSGARGSKVELDKDTFQINIDPQRMTEAAYEADCLAAALSMSVPNGEKWTTEDVKRLEPPGIVKKIAAKAYELTGATPEAAKDAEFFRQIGGGTDAAGADPDGAPAGE